MASVADHVHTGFVHVAFNILAIIALFGTIHLLSLSSDARWARAWIALGF